MRQTMTVVMTFLVAAFLFLQPAYADDLERIKADGKLTMAMSGQYPPFNFVNDKNELTGFDVEIGKEIAQRIG